MDPEETDEVEDDTALDPEFPYVISPLDWEWALSD